MSVRPFAPSAHFDGIPEHSTSHQLQGKRSACDRCRGQKLRCPREDHHGNHAPGKCLRCITAGAVCSFSTSKRAGRPPATSNVNAAERTSKEKVGQGYQDSRKARRPNSKRTVDIDHMAENQRREAREFRQCEGSRSDDETELESGNGGPHVTQAVPMPSLYEPDWGPFPDLAWIRDSEHATFESTFPTHTDPFGNLSWSVPAVSPSNKYVENQIASSGCNAPSAQHNILDPHNVNSTNRTLGQNLISEDVISIRDDGSVDMTNSTSTPGRKDPTRDGAESSESPREAQHQRVQELSELGMNLYSQVKHNEERHSAQANSGSLEIRDQDVGNILQSSATFLSLLTSFYPTATTPQTTTSTTSSDSDFSPSEGSIISDLSDFTSSRKNHHKSRKRVSTATSFTANTAYSHDKNSSKLPGMSAHEDNTKPLPADVPTIFQLLTCYLRLVHLHSIFYTQIHDYLNTRKTSLLPPLFPGMQIGGASLHDFQKFQIKLLIQISAHTLGEIEMALGLPDGYRISRRDAGRSGKGILESSVSVQFVEMVMREEGRRGCGGGAGDGRGRERERERDRVKSVRENLGKLKVLLRGTINI